MNDTKNRINKSIHPSKSLPYFKKLLSPRQFEGESIKGTEKIENLLQEKEKLIHKSIGPLDKIFSQEEIIRAISKSKNNKSSSGPIVNELLKANPTSTSHILIQLFSYILETQTFPKTWNLSLIKPVHKSGLQTKSTNYRGLCISNHLSKIFTSILNERLESYVKTHFTSSVTWI